MIPLSPRQKFISFLVLRQLAPRTVQSYTEWIVQLSRFHKRPPVDLGNVKISSWLLHLIEQRKLSASSINLAINPLQSFCGAHFGREIERLFHHRHRWRPSRPCLPHDRLRCGGTAVHRPVGGKRCEARSMSQPRTEARWGGSKPIQTRWPGIGLGFANSWSGKVQHR